jgi:RNA polymerase sigma-70 factor, ECF subfamily
MQAEVSQRARSGPGVEEEWKETASLVRLAQAGDREAFGALVVRFESTVLAICQRRLRNYSEAQELSQDIFLHVMSRLEQVRDPERFAGWLRQVASNLAINRATRRPPAHGLDSSLAEEPEERRHDPLRELIDQERAARLWDGLERLRSMDRDTLIAFYIDGQSLIEISHRHDAPVGTIKRRLHMARKRLKEELDGYGFDDAVWREDHSATGAFERLEEVA